MFLKLNIIGVFRVDSLKLCPGCMSEKETEQLCTVCGYNSGLEQESPLHLPPGTILKEKYLLGCVLGQGGFGVTYLAYDLNLKIKLAIKEYLPQQLASRSSGQAIISCFNKSDQEQYHYGLSKFLEEAQILARFNEHPSIVSVQDYFEENGTAYIVMNYLDGVTLQEYLKSRGDKIDLEEALAIFIPVLEALKKVHEQGFLHRDISPDNLFMSSSGQVVLIDFGAARFALGEKSTSLSVIMKVGYSPEEQHRSKGEQGPWTDIYALAASIYRAVTGQVPPNVLDRLEEDTLIRPSELGAIISPASERAILRGLAVWAKDRYQNADDFIRALQVDGSEFIASPSTEAVSPWNWIKGGLLRNMILPLFLLLFLGVVVYFTTSGARDSATTTINVPAEYASIQAAIDASSDGDVIIVEPGRYLESIDFGGKNIILRSTNPDDKETVSTTIIDGDGSSSVVTFRSGETEAAKLLGFTITGGKGSRYTLNIGSDDEPDLVTAYFGGGVNILHYSFPVVENNIISDNSAVFGGGVNIYSAYPTMTGNTIVDNSASYGGGVLVCKTEDSPLIKKNQILGNHAEYFGGGLQFGPYARAEVTENDIYENKAEYGGGVIVTKHSEGLIHNNQIIGNAAENGGGIAVIDHSSPVVSANLIRDNTAKMGGGGISVTLYSKPLIENNNIEENEAEYEGSGIFITTGAEPIVNNNRIILNRSLWGGGISVLHEASPQISRNFIYRNSAEAGGGIIVNEAFPEIFENQVSENIATVGSGGGIYTISASELLIKDNDFINNSAETVGGAISLAFLSSAKLDSNNFTNNSAQLGGALHVAEQCHADLSGNSLKKNFAQLGGAVSVAENGTIVLDDYRKNIFDANDPDNIHAY